MMLIWLRRLKVVLSAARFFLFGSRDVWFVVALPVFLYEVLGWRFMQVGSYLALWVIGYGGIQSFSPVILSRVTDGKPPGPAMASTLGLGLAATNVFYAVNGHRLVGTNDEAYDLVIAVAEGELREIADIAARLADLVA